MNIARIQYPIFAPYNKATVEIYLSGCHGCAGKEFCHNPELQDFNYGQPLLFKDILKLLDKYEGFYEAVSITGGDLLCQDMNEAITFTVFLHDYLKLNKKEFWLFTGKNTVPDWCKKFYDVIKVGEYREDLKQEGFPASSNQIVLYKGKDY